MGEGGWSAGGGGRGAGGLCVDTPPPAKPSTRPAPHFARAQTPSGRSTAKLRACFFSSFPPPSFHRPFLLTALPFTTVSGAAAYLAGPPSAPRFYKKRRRDSASPFPLSSTQFPSLPLSLINPEPSSSLPPILQPRIPRLLPCPVELLYQHCTLSFLLLFNPVSLASFLVPLSLILHPPLLCSHRNPNTRSLPPPPY